MEILDIKLKVIGRVSGGLREPAHRDNWKEIEAEITVDPDYSQALDNLEESSHILVIYWLHRQPGREPALKVHPRGNKEIPLKGLFATRSPNRPNPIGVTTVRLLERQGNVLKVRGLDALDGTPVLDLKPYIPGYDSTEGVEVPPWLDRP